MSILLSVVLIIVGFLLLIKGADFLVDGSSNIAKRFHIPEIIIGLTIVSIGTSLPELMVSLKSAISGHSDMSVGNVIGSNICNLLLILGLSSTIRPLIIKRETRLIEVPICLALTIVFAIFCNTSSTISRIEAIALIVLFSMFIVYTIIMGKKGEKFDEEPGELENKEEKTENKKPVSMVKNILFILLGIVALKFGGDLVVDYSTVIAEHFNISEQIISLTIVAIGTSLPELVTSVIAAIKGNSDISIGNILGSNIFNMAFIMGITALISPVAYNLVYNFELGILIVASIVLALFPIIPPKNKMSRRNGILYLILYVAYMVTLFNK